MTFDAARLMEVERAIEEGRPLMPPPGGWTDEDALQLAAVLYSHCRDGVAVDAYNPTPEQLADPSLADVAADVALVERASDDALIGLLWCVDQLRRSDVLEGQEVPIANETICPTDELRQMAQRLRQEAPAAAGGTQGAKLGWKLKRLRRPPQI